jgi:hypothetical protein
MMMPSGQALKHWLHAVQPSVKSGSQIAPGGRTGLAVIVGNPRSRFRRALSIGWVTSNQAPGGPKII